MKNSVHKFIKFAKILQVSALLIFLFAISSLSACSKPNVENESEIDRIKDISKYYTKALANGNFGDYLKICVNSNDAHKLENENKNFLSEMATFDNLISSSPLASQVSVSVDVYSGPQADRIVSVLSKKLAVAEDQVMAISITYKTNNTVISFGKFLLLDNKMNPQFLLQEQTESVNEMSIYLYNQNKVVVVSEYVFQLSEQE